ncbi:unnamed protein product [Nyctereutes procyonoides]|uniref:(raccoon dog) hypothetical protein n=1 Tax=Nyctereutes procyonoides TaxID=34880 RepID=A0A811Y6Z0_NYCPR|nr:unnamed protein product [Nyctereutes procyonoides]
MASNLKSAKDLVVFLGKSVIACLESMVFTIIPKPRKNVAGEIVLITGAGSGLGRLLALRFARLGSVLVFWDINKEGNEDTCRMAREAGATRVYAYTCDCSQREDIYRVAEQVRPFLLPVLEPEYVVDKIVDAILQEKVYLYVPRFISFVMFLKSILPVKVSLLVADYMGALNIMDGFVGKNKKE